MNVITPEQFGEVVLVCWKAFFFGAVVAVWVGKLFADATVSLIFEFLWRWPRWRRFRRAARKVMA
ncbi:hypothetical protein [Dyella jiangningensis]|uniref:Uncharacterized protein n=1 Tax=Dyella jiangningensis TaxID=1379159 RepID=A0A328PF27_9GAMM|nr:hypothetical protein [Dyella jiangningensis]RAO78194.1 hypothetical protein CA260_10335 [Dyella jiangningensis]